MSKTNNNLDMDKYNSLIDKLDTISITLKSINMPDVEIPEKSCNLSATLEYSGDKYIVKDNNILECLPAFIVEIVNSDNKNVLIMRLNVVFSIKYHVENLNEFEDSYIRYFIMKNVPLNIWPYGREIISSITTRIGLPSLVIEPFKLKA